MKNCREKSIGKSLICFISALVILFLVIPYAWCAQSDYDGTYAGTYAGPDNGLWVAIVSSSSDSLFLSYSTDFILGDGGLVSYDGEAVPVGNFSSTSVLRDTMINVSVDSSDGSVTGTWDDPNDGDGDITGSLIVDIPFAGTYSGTFTGDATGTWTMTIASDGSISGSITEEGVSASFKGGAHPQGYVVAFGTDPQNLAFAFFGTVSGTTISGEWALENGDGGTFSTAGAATGGGDGGGGGCFIHTVIGK